MGSKYLTPILVFIALGVGSLIFFLPVTKMETPANEEQVIEEKDKEPEAAVSRSIVPKNLEGVTMTTRRDPYGYEITYPANWHTLDTSAEYHRSGSLIKSEYFFSPFPIDKELVDPVEARGCEEEECAMLREERKRRWPLFTIRVEGGGESGFEQYPNRQEIVFGGLKGFTIVRDEGDTYYQFSKDGFIYGIFVRHSFIDDATAASANWVLSTFKVTEI